MGCVIKPDTEGSSTAALTKTGKGGLLSNGYLRDDPARAYLGDGETPAYVVTNADEGVIQDRGGDERTITPGKGYRTIAVITDRRLIVLVGNVDDGDERVTLPFVEVASAQSEDGDLVVGMQSGETWRLHAGDDEVESVAAYVDRMATTWAELEATLDAVKRTLVTATAKRDGGAFQDGIEEAQAAHDELADAAALVEDLPAKWPVEGLRERVEAIRARCIRTLADVRIGHGRSLADEAEQCWQADDFEAAHDLFDRARAEFSAVGALAADRHDRGEAVTAGLERIDAATEELRAAPLERAIDADRRAGHAEGPAAAVADWQLARQRYLETLALDEEAPERRFDGDPEKIRERIETVTDRIFDIARDDGAEALGAGKWFLEADRPGVAREEAAVACDVFEVAIAVAREATHADVEEFEEWLADAEETVATAKAESETESPRDGSEDDARTADGDDADEGSSPSDGNETTESRSNGGPLGPFDLAGADPDALAMDEDDPSTIGSNSDEGEDRGQDGAATPEDPHDPEPATEPDADTPTEEHPPVPEREPDTPKAEGEEDKDDAELSGPSLDDVELPDLEEDTDDERTATESDVDGDDSDGDQAEEPEAVVSDGAGATTADVPGVSLEIRLRALDPDAFDELAGHLLAADGLEPADPPADAPYDLLGASSAEPTEAVAVWTIHRPIAGPIGLDQIASIARRASDLDEDVTLVTSSPTTEEATALAAEESIEIRDRSDVAAAIEGPMPDLFDRVGPGAK